MTLKPGLGSRLKPCPDLPHMIALAKTLGTRNNVGRLEVFEMDLQCMEFRLAGADYAL